MIVMNVLGVIQRLRRRSRTSPSTLLMGPTSSFASPATQGLSSRMHCQKDKRRSCFVEFDNELNLKKICDIT